MVCIKSPNLSIVDGFLWLSLRWCSMDCSLVIAFERQQEVYRIFALLLQTKLLNFPAFLDLL